MAGIHVDGVCLSKLSDSKLRRLTAALREDSRVAQHADWLATWAQPVTTRKALEDARRTVSSWEHVNTATTHTEASPESREWSNLEGGHTFHQVASFGKWFKGASL